MSKATMILDYLVRAASLGGASTVSFDSTQMCWDLPLGMVREGILDVSFAQTIHASYAEAHADVLYGQRSIPLLLSLRALVGADGSPYHSLLMLPAILDADGQLALDPRGRAWIPLDRLDVHGLDNPVLTVCDIDAYRVHQNAMSALPDDGSWGFAVDRALDLFEALCSLDETLLASKGLRIERDSVRARVWEVPDTLMASAEVLREARDRLQAEDVVASAPFASLLGIRRSADGAEQLLPTLDQDALIAHKLLSGNVAPPDSLTHTDSEAIVSFTKQGEGDTFVLRAPKDTARIPVVLDCMANLLTEHALRGDPAPVMLCVGTRDHLGDLMSLLERRPLVGQTSVLTRWIPRVGTSGEPDNPTKRILGSLQSLAAHHVTTEDSVFGGCLPQTILHAATSGCMDYADSWYLPQASTYFLDHASKFLGTREHDMGNAVARLEECLRLVDQYRCELVDAYATVCQGAEHILRRDELVSRLGMLRRSYAKARRRLAFWEKVLADNPPHRNMLVGRNTSSQADLIRDLADENEDIALECTLVEDVCTAYRVESKRLEKKIGELRVESSELARMVRAAEPEGQRCSQLAERLTEICDLSASQTTLLESTVDGHDVSLDRLNDVLDRTVRPVEFWIAVHVYEGTWIRRCQEDPQFLSDIRSEGQRGMRARANLLPVNVISLEYAGAVPLRISRDHDSVTTDAPYDLLVLLSGDKTDIPTGAALVAKAQRVLVAGSSETISPKPLFGSTSDELLASSSGGASTWRQIQAAGLVLSEGTSFFSLITHDDINECGLSDAIHSYEELCDLRTELHPAEAVHSVRTPPSGTDDPNYALAGIVPPLSYVLVPDSAWEQVGSSRRNRSEALAATRWVSSHVASIARRYPDNRRPICLLVPHRAQASLVSKLLKDRVEQHGLVEVRCLYDVGSDTWPIVLYLATCGPDNMAPTYGFGAREVLANAAASSTDALVFFCGGIWLSSSDLAVKSFMGRATLLGKLFSAARKRKASRYLKSKPRGDGSGPEDRTLLELDVRAKPLSLTTLLHRLWHRGALPKVPPTAKVNRALESAGLIERCNDKRGHAGWRPTIAGREVGILPTHDKYGNPFCIYSSSAEQVLLSVVESMSTEMQENAQ